MLTNDDIANRESLFAVKDALATLPKRPDEQRFRQAAIRLGLNYLTGRSMMVRLSDVPAILKEATCSSSHRGAGKKSGTSKADTEANVLEKARLLAIAPSPKRSARR